MTRKTYWKMTSRMFRENRARLCIIATTTMISTAIITGLGNVAPRFMKIINYLRTMGMAEEDLMELYTVKNGLERLSFIFPIFFMFVTCLVVFMTLTRLVAVERSQIGCLKTLGYSWGDILMKYVIFTGVASLVGVIPGIILGQLFVYPTLFAAVVARFELPNPAGITFPAFGIVAALISFAFAMSVTLVTLFKVTRETPSQLLKTPCPSAGGKILLERITFFWRPLPFRYKSTLRNIFRYRMRFFMTVSTVTFATALVFCGMGLSFGLRFTTTPEIMETIRPISSIIVLAAVILNALVMYNITNINIEERRREIATLRVLGYHNIEVSSYIFREIFILTVIGVIIGLPVGYYFMDYIFSYLGFGNIEFVGWFVWFIVAILSFSSLAIANLLLFRKIHDTDMNASLKTVE